MVTDDTPPQQVVDNTGVIDLAAERRLRQRTNVRRNPDPENPNKNFFFITSATREGVQAEIDFLTSDVESSGGNGYGEFVGPHRFGDYFLALGVTEIFID